MTTRCPTSLLPVLALALAACASSDQAGPGPTATVDPCPDGASPMARLELLFGTGRDGLPPVGAAEWARFLDEEVTPRFPDGLTVMQGQGQWRGDDGAIAKEGSIVLLVYHTPDATTEADIAAIREAYKARFDQESVMRVDGGTDCVSF